MAASQPREYSFKSNLDFSDDVVVTERVVDILMFNIPGARQVVRASEGSDKAGVDYWVETGAAKLIAIDVKARREDWLERGYDDLAIETFSVIEKHKAGWTRDEHKRCDMVLWVWPTGRWCMLPFPLLCAVAQEHWESWRLRYKTYRQKSPEFDGWHSEFVLVPRREVLDSINRRFYGLQPGQHAPQ